MLEIENSQLVVIDVQGNLALAMHNSTEVIARIETCIKAAKLLKIPIICTEQVPQKLGSTINPIAVALGDVEKIAKSSFSCWGAPAFQNQIKGQHRKQIVIVGIEAHVCVFQTVADLLAAKYNVYVVTDAISSRTAANKTVALNRMHDLGAVLITSEMMACELIRSAEHPQFKNILSLIK